MSNIQHCTADMVRRLISSCETPQWWMYFNPDTALSPPCPPISSRLPAINRDQRQQMLLPPLWPAAVSALSQTIGPQCAVDTRTHQVGGWASTMLEHVHVLKFCRTELNDSGWDVHFQLLEPHEGACKLCIMQTGNLCPLIGSLCGHRAACEPLVSAHATQRTLQPHRQRRRQNTIGRTYLALKALAWLDGCDSVGGYLCWITERKRQAGILEIALTWLKGLF